MTYIIVMEHRKHFEFPVYTLRCDRIVEDSGNTLQRHPASVPRVDDRPEKENARPLTSGVHTGTVLLSTTEVVSTML